MSETIQPRRFYTFKEAAEFVPSCKAGKKLSPLTLHRWVQRGELKAEMRQCGKRRFWFIQGIELLRFQAPVQKFDGVTPDEVQREHDRAMKFLREEGLV